MAEHLIRTTRPAMTDTLPARRGLYCFSQDLRLQDNPALNNLISQTDEILFIYILDLQGFRQNKNGFASLGGQRWRFLKESLLALKASLQRYGHDLHLLSGNRYHVLSELCQQYQISTLAGSYNSGLDEYHNWQQLQQVPDISVPIVHQNALWTKEQLPDHLLKLPRQFTPFRRQMEALTVPAPVTLKEGLQHIRPLPPPDHSLHCSSWPDSPAPHGHAPFIGGEDQGWQQLHHYFWQTRQLSDYKQTRNELDGWQNSSRLSPWLALGCLSPRQIWSDIEQYETQICCNESTGWLKQELLWREFFYWSAHRLGADLYRSGGERHKNLLTSFYPQRFRSWQEGSTPYPLVNACMKQLNSTGFLSNRGRQIAASALVNELAVSWHYGAAYFESQLLDYDPGSNYGNWQYIAGVGADPRGGRHFNLERQRATYDPDNHFIRKWQGDATMVEDTIGIDDWPIR